MKFSILLPMIFCSALGYGAEPQPPTTGEQPPAQESPQKTETFEEAFQKGIELYRQSKFAEAATHFQRASEVESSNVPTLTNLALAEFQAGNKPIAVALLRKAIALDPDFSTPAAGIKFILPQLEVREIPHEIQLRESLRNQLLAPVPLTAYLILTAVFLLGGGWLLLGFWGARRRAIKMDLQLPPFPTVGALFLLAFILTSSLSIAKIIDYQIPRGTIIKDKIQVMSAPDSASVGLFDLYGGLEVVLETVKEEWVQVTYPGALSGWIPRSAVYPTSGKNLW
jgi:tetratricopeptide (TPR) repeat protein